MHGNRTKLLHEELIVIHTHDSQSVEKPPHWDGRVHRHRWKEKGREGGREGGSPEQ